MIHSRNEQSEIQLSLYFEQLLSLIKTGCPTDITDAKKLCKEIGVGEHDWISEEGEEKKMKLFSKWSVQLMSCWSKRERT